MAKEQNYAAIKKQDIFNWCKENNKIDWLKKVGHETVVKKVYPKVPDENGKMIADKTATPTTVEVPMSFTELRKRFVAECLGKKSKKPLTLQEEIDAL